VIYFACSLLSFCIDKYSADFANQPFIRVRNTFSLSCRKEDV